MSEHTTDELHEAFLSSNRPHILNITNHGIHQWVVIPGLPDTGGQNVFVNQFTSTLVELGFKVTIVNRGGYPHPITGKMHTGLRYKNEHARILYIEDDKKAFVRKEDMDEQLPQLQEFLRRFLEEEGGAVDLIISHYWDAAKLGILLNRSLPVPVRHVWVPHSLGTIKKRNMPPASWDKLRVDERIQVEKSIIADVDGIAATSSAISQTLKEDFSYTSELFLPPCIETDRYHPRAVEADHEIWQFLSEATGLPVNEVRECQIITEISRTDKTKQKDVLIKAFAKVHEKNPDTILVVTIDDTEKELAKELRDLIQELGIKSHTAVIGYEWDRLPYLYSITAVYCTPSIMEGFGMAIQEAAATGVASVGSNLIPFLTEYLLGDEPKSVSYDGGGRALQVGAGGIMAQAGDVDGFAHAIDMLLSDEALRREMGQQAYHITIPFFTWKHMTLRLLGTVGVDLGPKPKQLSRLALKKLMDTKTLDQLTVPDMFTLFREEKQLAKFLPDGVAKVDPRDGALILYNSARARRPHDYASPSTESMTVTKCPVCEGNTTSVIDVVELSEGFTFINKNLFPVVYPESNLSAADMQPIDFTDPSPAERTPYGLHFLQWTSSLHDRDWHNMPLEDRVKVFERLATLERKLLFGSEEVMPLSASPNDGKKSHGFVSMFKNYGLMVGGSLSHGHQQICFSNVMPQRFYNNWRFYQDRGELFSTYMLRENPSELLIRDYGEAVLLVPYFMKRPYYMMLILKDASKQYLHELTAPELEAVANGWHDAIRAILTVMPKIGRTVAYNVTTLNGPGAGLYFEFLPYTQETGGYEQLGLWICQGNPQDAAAAVREILENV